MQWTVKRQVLYALKKSQPFDENTKAIEGWDKRSDWLIIFNWGLKIIGGEIKREFGKGGERERSELSL